MGIIVHIDLPGSVDVKFKAALDASKVGQRLSQSFCVGIPTFVAVGTPEGGDGRDGVFDIDPSGTSQRAVGDRARRRRQIESIVAALDEPDVPGVEIAR